MSPSPVGRRWLGLIAVSLGVALIVVDTTIVNVIVPSLVADLGITSAQAQWVQESYAIVFAALLLLTGRLADLVGARRVFLVGVAVFAATSVLAGLAPSGGVLIVARVLQGAAAVMILPSSLTLVNGTFTGKERGQAFAVGGSTIGAAAAVGPLLGGALAEVSWRWAFGINIALGVLILFEVRAFHGPSPRQRRRRSPRRGAVGGRARPARLRPDRRPHLRMDHHRPTARPRRSVLGPWTVPRPGRPAGSRHRLIAFARRQSTLSRGGGAALMDVRLASPRSGWSASGWPWRSLASPGWDCSSPPTAPGGRSP